MSEREPVKSPTETLNQQPISTYEGYKIHHFSPRTSSVVIDNKTIELPEDYPHDKPDFQH